MGSCGYLPHTILCLLVFLLMFLFFNGQCAFLCNPFLERLLFDEVGVISESMFLVLHGLPRSPLVLINVQANINKTGSKQTVLVV